MITQVCGLHSASFTLFKGRAAYAIACVDMQLRCSSAQRSCWLKAKSFCLHLLKI